jgi:hypothetical protein
VSHEPYARNADPSDHSAEAVAHDLDATHPRVRFRRYLTARVSNVADLEWYLEQSAAGFSADPQVRLAVEELIDHLGRLIGFAGDRHETEHCAVWCLDGRPRLIVRVLDGDEAQTRLTSLILARDTLAATGALPSAREVTCLAVVCEPRPGRVPDEAMLLRRGQGQVRLVTVDALVALGRACETRSVSPSDAIQLLQPADAYADRLIALVARLARE